MQPSYQSGFYAPGRGVAKHPELWRGCVGAWNPGLGNTGLSLRDWSGNQNNGTLTNGPTWGVSDGRQALTFDGTNDYVTVENVANKAFRSAITYSVSLWFNAVSVANNPVIASQKGGLVPNQFFIELASSGAAIYWGNSNGSNAYRTYATTANYADNHWHHLVVVKTGAGNSGKLYLDGREQLSYTGTLTSTSTSNFGSLIYGVYGLSLGLPFNGLMSDMLIHTQALSPQEIRTLAQRPGIAYELAPRKTYFIQAATSTSQFYDVLSPLIFAGTN